jgi:hypothetical protein
MSGIGHARSLGKVPLKRKIALEGPPARPLAPSLRLPNLAQGAGFPAPGHWQAGAGAASRQGTASTFPRLAWLVPPPPEATTTPSGGGR